MKKNQATVSFYARQNIKLRLMQLMREPESFEPISKAKLTRMIHALRKQKSTEFFAVMFIRRLHKDEFPTERVMRCSFNVTKYLKGGPDRYDPLKKNLVWVFDFEVMDYRSINMETLLEATIRGVRYKVIED